MHLISFHPWHCFLSGVFSQIINQAFQNVTTVVRMSHFTSSEKYCGFYLVSVREETFNVLLLKLVIVLVNLGSKLYLFNLDGFLVFLSLPRPFLFLVLIPSEVHDTTNGRLGGRRDFDKVETFFTRYGECLLRWHHPQLFAIVVDYTNLAHPNAFVNARAALTKIAAWPSWAASYRNSLLPSLCWVRFIVKNR